MAHQARVHSDQMVLMMAAERLDRMTGGQKTLKAKLNFMRDYQARVHSGQMVLMVVRQGGLCCLSSGHRRSKDSKIMTLGSQLKDGQSDCPKKRSTYSFSVDFEEVR